MRALIEALMDSGYTLVVCRDNLYTFKLGYITVLVNTYTLTGGYAMVSIHNCPGKMKPRRINNISELNALIRNYRAMEKVDLSSFKAINLQARNDTVPRELNLVD